MPSTLDKIEKIFEKIFNNIYILGIIIITCLLFIILIIVAVKKSKKNSKLKKKKSKKKRKNNSNANSNSYFSEKEEGNTNANYLQSDFRVNSFRTGEGDVYYKMEKSLMNKPGMIKKKDGSFYVNGNIYDRESMPKKMKESEEKSEFNEGKSEKNQDENNHMEQDIVSGVEGLRLTNYEKNKLLAEKIMAEDLSEFDFPSIKTSEMDERDRFFQQAKMGNIEVQKIVRRSEQPKTVVSNGDRQSLNLRKSKLRGGSFGKQNDLTPLLKPKYNDVDDLTIYESVQTETNGKGMRSNHSRSLKSNGMKNRIGSQGKSLRKSGDDGNTVYESCTWESQTQTQDNESFLAFNGSIFKGGQVGGKKGKNMFQSVKGGGKR